VTRDREPIDRARDVLAMRIEDDYPGITAGHDIRGWWAMRGGRLICRAESEPGLRAILPHCLGRADAAPDVSG
jgi:hypothetical protein